MRCCVFLTALLIMAFTRLSGTMAQAQTASGEYWYSFAAPSLQEGIMGKHITGAVVDVDPEASVLVDVEADIVVVRTTVPLIVERLEERSAQLGLSLTLRNGTDTRNAPHVAKPHPNPTASRIDLDLTLTADAQLTVQLPDATG